MYRTWLIVMLWLGAWSLGEAATNTPYRAGTRVAVTGTAGTVEGVLQDVEDADWVGVREANRRDVTYIRGTDLIVRRLEREAAAAFDGRARRSFAPPPPSPVVAEAGDILESVGGHYIHGRPRVAIDHFSFTPEGSDEAVDGITYHAREAFTIGHFNRMKTPAWVAMRWTTDDLARSEAVDLDRPEFGPDLELPFYAQTGKNLHFNLHQLERGHMARDADLEAWGADAVAEGMRMSNICPQLKGRNHVVWGKLENQHRFIVKNPQQTGINTVYIVSGPIFFDDNEDGEIAEDELERIGDDDVARPDATYKVIAWEDDNGFNMRAYMIEQNDTDVNLTNYLRSVDEIEAWTGLDFFWQLDDALENALEAQVASSLWN